MENDTSFDRRETIARLAGLACLIGALLVVLSLPAGGERAATQLPYASSD